MSRDNQQPGLTNQQIRKFKYTLKQCLTWISSKVDTSVCRDLKRSVIWFQLSFTIHQCICKGEREIAF